MTQRDYGFFVGYLNNVSRPIASFSIMAGLVLVCLFGGLAMLLGRGADVASAGQDFSDSEVQISGIIRQKPYPLVLVSADAAHPDGQAIMLAGDSKRAPDGLVEGQAVSLDGLLLKRGTLDMLVLGKSAPAHLPGPSALAAQSHGRWRVSGEICDGKCNAGAMRPGSGLAHKACANLCLAGGLPPVLVMRQSVLGTNFLLLADENGNPAPESMRDLTALPVELEGEIESLGNILIMRVDWQKAYAL